jgi:hypothetical protein
MKADPEPFAAQINYLDVYLHGNPLRRVGVQTRVHNLVPPDDHDLLKKVGHLLGLLLGARHDQLGVGEVVLVTASRQLL